MVVGRCTKMWYTFFFGRPEHTNDLLCDSTLEFGIDVTPGIIIKIVKSEF